MLFIVKASLTLRFNKFKILDFLKVLLANPETPVKYSFFENLEKIFLSNLNPQNTIP